LPVPEIPIFELANAAQSQWQVFAEVPPSGRRTSQRPSEPRRVRQGSLSILMQDKGRYVELNDTAWYGQQMEMEMEAPKLELTLIPAPDDAPLRSSKYQKGLRRFADSLKAEGVTYGLRVELIEAAGGGEAPAIFSGIFTLATVLTVQVSRCVIAWQKGRSGRKVRVEIRPDGRLKAEAQTTEDVERLLTKVGEYQQIMREIVGKKSEEEKLSEIPTKRPKRRPKRRS
jgi:hypothetical protein